MFYGDCSTGAYNRFPASVMLCIDTIITKIYCMNGTSKVRVCYYSYLPQHFAELLFGCKQTITGPHSNNLTVVHTKIFQKVIGKLSMKSFYYEIFTVHFATKVHNRVPFHKPDLRKGCCII